MRPRKISPSSLAPKRKFHAISVAPKRKLAVSRRDEVECGISKKMKTTSPVTSVAGCSLSYNSATLMRMVQVYASDSCGRQIIRQTIMPSFHYSVEKVIQTTIDLANSKASIIHDFPNLFTKRMQRGDRKRRKREPSNPECVELEGIDLTKLFISHPAVATNVSDSLLASDTNLLNPFYFPLKFERQDPILQGSFCTEMMMSDERACDVTCIHSASPNLALANSSVLNSTLPESSPTSVSPQPLWNGPAIREKLPAHHSAPESFPFYQNLNASRSVPPKVIERKARQSMPPKFRYPSIPVPKAGKWLVFGQVRHKVMYSADREILGFRILLKKSLRRSLRNN